MDERLPVIIGVGQVTQRPGTERPREPLALMAEAARLAEADSGVAGMLGHVDSVRVVNIISWPSKDPPADLARALGASPRELVYTTIGGNAPQWQVNEAAERVHAGASEVTLIAGAEAVYSARRARQQNVDLGWTPRGNPTPNAGDGRPGHNAIEAAHGATLPVRIYPLFENALRAHYGRGIEEHQRALGELCAQFSAVAADNPHAWFRQPKTAEEIATADATNRYIAFPYPKYMNSIIDVDQGAALLVASAAAARRLGVPEDRRVYLHGCGDATDHWFITERVDYHSSPAIRAATGRALAMAGATAGEIRYFDLYSCFPSAVEIGRDMLGIAPDDGRALTVTGGLPYFGGPGNNYVTHSIATMVERLRDDRGALGMVTANGWYVTKHSAGVYGAEPPRGEWRRTDPKEDQARIGAEPHPPFIAEPSGKATVETYTVVFDRDGAPELGIIIGRTEDGRRFIANAPDERALLESMTQREMIGTAGTVVRARDGERNVFSPG
ncbi:MAG TPA: acetyl-CoA acetyltransferase [Dehalococcoidia bacterium]|nr:acetyl-CoA acetyltransferase [Dehalococcoidia bacterium]